MFGPLATGDSPLNLEQLLLYTLNTEVLLHSCSVCVLAFEKK